MTTTTSVICASTRTLDRMADWARNLIEGLAEAPLGAQLKLGRDVKVKFERRVEVRPADPSTGCAFEKCSILLPIAGTGEGAHFQVELSRMEGVRWLSVVIRFAPYGEETKEEAFRRRNRDYEFSDADKVSVAELAEFIRRSISSIARDYVERHAAQAKRARASMESLIERS